MSVSDADVSVVVQGPIGAYLPEVVESVRTHLPAAELVLSTWRGSDVAGLDVDVTVLNDDPGSVPYRIANGAGGARMFNTNRMLRSARAGIAKATRPYVLKLRTDTPLSSAAVLDWAAHRGPRAPRLRVFEKRVLTLSVATRPGGRSSHYLFHPSDCVHFGLRTDLQLLWSAPEIDEDENAGFWARRDPQSTNLPFPSATARYWNEQVLWLHALRATGHAVDYPYTGFTAPGLLEASDLSVVNNFVVLEPWQLGVGIPKLQEMVTASDPGGYLWFDDWQRLSALLEAA